MSKLETYCQVEFLEALYTQIENDLISFLEDDNDNYSAELYKLLHGKCELILDSTEEEIFRRGTEQNRKDFNPNFKKLWKNGIKKFISYKETFLQMENDEKYFNNKTNELFFLSNNSINASEIKNRFGVLCKNKDSINGNLSELFRFYFYSLNKRDRYKGWKEIFKFNLPCNSMIIADNYLFSDKPNNKFNIYSILVSILPAQLNIDFHLTILTRNVTNLEKEYRELCNYLKSNFTYRIRLCICLINLGNNSIHDRNILTNYLWINSGAGFNIFKQTVNSLNSKHNTTISFFPLTCDNGSPIQTNRENSTNTSIQAAYFNILHHYKDIWKSTPEQIGNQRLIIGDKINRLLE